MSDVAQEVSQVVEGVVPDSPFAEVAQAVVETVTNPNPMTLINDIKVAIKLVEKMKSQLSTAHPSVWELVKSLL